jgi:hypothetical protein
MIGSSCFTSGIRRVSLVTIPVTSHERRKDREVFTISGTYQWSFGTQIFHNGQPSHGGDRKTFEVITSTLLIRTTGSVASLLAATLYQGRPDRNHKLWNIVKETLDYRHTFCHDQCNKHAHIIWIQNL